MESKGTKEEVYDLIIKFWSRLNLLDKSRAKGRATKGAALASLGKTCYIKRIMLRALTTFNRTGYSWVFYNNFTGEKMNTG
jgi:hypothetical protein